VLNAYTCRRRLVNGDLRYPEAMARITLLGLLVLAACGGGGAGKGARAPAPPPPEPSPPIAATPGPEAPADEPPPPEPEEPDEPAEPPPEPVTMTFQPKAPKVELLSKGKGKRALLRYKAAVGDPVDCSMVMDLRVKNPALRDDVVVPTTTMSWTGTITSVEKPAFTATAVVDVLDVAPGDNPISQRAGDEVAKKLGPMRNGTIVTKMSDRGVPLETVFTSMGPLDAQTAMGMQLGAGGGVVLPEQPIGVGGKWRVTRVEDQGFVVTTTVATFELVSRTGEAASIRGTVVATGRSSLAPDTVATGTSELTFLGDACAASKATMHTELPAPVNMTMDMTMETRRRDGR
jgi:hypothetical protein